MPPPARLINKEMSADTRIHTHSVCQFLIKVFQNVGLNENRSKEKVQSWFKVFVGEHGGVNSQETRLCVSFVIIELLYFNRYKK